MGSSASTSKSKFLKQDAMICSNCSSTLNFITKRKCDLCNQYFCKKCLKVTFQNISNTKICQKCSILQSGKFSREDLEVYSVKELRQFLSRSKISLSNCCEKSDLVALALKTTSFEANIEDFEHRRHVLHLKEKMEKEIMSASQPSASPDMEHIHDEVLDPVVDEERSDTCTIEQSNFVPHDGNLETSSMGDECTPPILYQDFIPQSQEVLTSQSQDDTADINRDCADSEQHKPEFQFKDPVKLEDITYLSQVEHLNVRQMKELLTRNFVNYKGCCEREELSGMIINLWKEHSKNASYENLEQSLKVDLCKICMDQVIDCVLLECGHMVACKKCSKQLAECPICRKYVSRVVHVFRA